MAGGIDPPPLENLLLMLKKTFEIYPVSKIYQTNLQIFENLLNSIWDEEKIKDNRCEVMQINYLFN